MAGDSSRRASNSLLYWSGSEFWNPTGSFDTIDKVPDKEPCQESGLLSATRPIQRSLYQPVPPNYGQSLGRTSIPSVDEIG